MIVPSKMGNPIIIAFLPVEIINTFPPVLRPVLGNGFVVGVAAALVLEHGVFKK